jgi:hypothetical protein
MGSNADEVKANEDAVTENAERIIKVTNIDFAGPSPDKMQLPTSVTLRLNVPYDADEDDIDDMVADDLEDRYGVKVSGFETQFAESIEEGDDTCPECGCPIGNPKPGCDCAHDVHMDEGIVGDFMRNSAIADNVKDLKTQLQLASRNQGGWKKEDIPALQAALAKLEESRMSDLHQHIGEMIADGASNEEIKKMHPMVKDSDIDSIRREMDESVQFEEVQEVDEVAESIAKMAAMAGVGSTARSNHGIREGEAGYQITPRSIVAREMRKLQDLANK